MFLERASIVPWVSADSTLRYAEKLFGFEEVAGYLRKISVQSCMNHFTSIEKKTVCLETCHNDVADAS